jgi:hypothetical protein
MMRDIPRRQAVVRTPQHCGNIPDGHGQRGFVTVTLPRMPWEQEITAPDPREETKPRRNPAAPPAISYRKQPAPPPGVMDGGDFA